MRKSCLFSVVWCVVGVFVVFSVCGCGKSTRSGLEEDVKVEYRLRLSEGMSYDVRVVSDTEERRGSDSGKRKISSQRSIGFGYRFDVKSVDDDGNAVVDCKVTWVKYKQKVGGGKSEDQDVDYDSSDKKRQTIPRGEGLADMAFIHARLIRAFLDEEFTVVISPVGKIEEIRGEDGLCEKMARKMDETGEAFRKFADVIWVSTLKNHILQPLAIFPEEAVGVGDSWTGMGLSVMPDYEIENELTLMGRKGGVARIEGDTEITIPSPGKDGELSEQTVRYSGQIEIDESTGQILKSRAGLEISSDSDMSIVTTFEMTKR